MPSSTQKAFIRGVLDGMAAPMTAFAPEPVHTKIDNWITTPTYHPWSEDRKNIRRDFEKVMGHIRQGIDTAENYGGSGSENFR